MLTRLADEVVETALARLEAFAPPFAPVEQGSVRRVQSGVVEIAGFTRVRANELLEIEGGATAIVFDAEPERLGAVLLHAPGAVAAGAGVRRTGRSVATRVGEGLLGRVVDPLGRPLDGGPAPEGAEAAPVERAAPAIMARAPVSVPLHTGIKAVDALVPIGRGQRELVLGDRQTGKTALALDAILAQADTGVLSVYCAIGQRADSVLRVVAALGEAEALGRTVVVAAGGEDAPGLQYIAPYAATSIAEHFMARARDVLVVYDDLTRHARAYRELSLLLRRPPGREAFPGDIFYLHARLLERATQFRAEHGGGSLTALPIVETQAQNLSAYIPTNLISITDGQIYLSPDLMRRGQMPPVDVGRSVSRVGGKAQLPGLRAVAGPLKLAYAQFEELEGFARFGARLDADTRRDLERGRRVRAALRQPDRAPIPLAEEIAVLLAAAEGLLDPVALDALEAAEAAIRAIAEAHLSPLAEGAELTPALREDFLAAARAALAEAGLGDGDG